MQCYMLTTSSPSGSEVDEGEVLALVEGVLASGGRVLAPDEGGLACSCLRRAACMSDICLLRSLICAGKFTISSVGGGGGGGASSCGGNSCVSSFTREVNTANSVFNLLRAAALLSTFLTDWQDLCLVSRHEDDSSNCASLSA